LCDRLLLVFKKLNKEIIQLFEEGVSIKSYETFYEEITDKDPKEYLDYHFYKNINISSNSDNTFYKVFHRILDVIISIIGLLCFAFIIPVVFVCNLLANRGPFFTLKIELDRKERFLNYAL